MQKSKEEMAKLTTGNIGPIRQLTESEYVIRGLTLSLNKANDEIKLLRAKLEKAVGESNLST